MKMVDNDKLEAIKIKARENHVPILQDASLEFIEIMLTLATPKSILEVGTSVGYSALCFSRHLEDGGKIVTTNIDDFLRPKIQRKGKKQQDAKTVINEINKKFTQKELVPYIASEYIETSEFKEAIKDKEEKVVTNEDVKEETINILK